MTARINKRLLLWRYLLRPHFFMKNVLRRTVKLCCNRVNMYFAVFENMVVWFVRQTHIPGYSILVSNCIRNKT